MSEWIQLGWRNRWRALFTGEVLLDVPKDVHEATLMNANRRAWSVLVLFGVSAPVRQQVGNAIIQTPEPRC